MTGGRLVAGVDCSTQSTKILLMDPDTGEVVARGQASHVVTGTDGARESDPRGWWTAVRDALAETGRAGEVGAISVAGQQHGLVVLDAAGEPLRDASLWNDTRAAADAERLTEELGASAGRASPASARTPRSRSRSGRGSVAPSPRSRPRPRAVQLPHDYVTGRLTGAAATDRGDASGTGWWSPTTGAYEPAILDHPSVALDAGLLPRLLGPRELAGEVTSAVAAELGLAPGPSSGPAPATTWARRSGSGWASARPPMSLGTSGTIFAVSERPTADPTGVVAGFADAAGRLPAARLHAQLHARRRPDRGVARPRPRRRRAGRLGGGLPVPRRRAHARPARRRRHDPWPPPHLHAGSRS